MEHCPMQFQLFFYEVLVAAGGSTMKTVFLLVYDTNIRTILMNC